MNVDPTGLEVKIQTSDKSAYKLLANAYAELNITIRGREITSQLEKSKDTYLIKPITKDAFYKPSEKTTYMDPYNLLKLPTAQGMEAAPLSVVLGHELGHAIGDKDDGLSRMNNVTKK